MTRRAPVFVLLIAATAAGAPTEVTMTGPSKFSAIVSRSRPARPAAIAADAVPTVAPQPAPVANHVPLAANLSPNRPSIDPAQIRAGKVVALRNDRPELVNEASLAVQLDGKQILVDRTDLVARAVTLPSALQSRLRATAPAVDSKQGLLLSYRVLAYDASAEKRQVHLEPLLVDATGLLFDAGQHSYVGTVILALLDESNRDASGGLSQPVAVLVTAKGAATEPNVAKFDRYGPGVPQEVAVRVVDPPAGGFSIQASADFGATYNGVELAVSHPAVKVIPPNPDPIDGWGIGTTTLHVQVSDIVSPDQFQILFAGDVGLDPNPVHFDRSGLGTFQWRSHGTDSSTITVATPGIVVEPVTIKFMVPWRFLLLAAGGGLVGAFLRGRGRDEWPKALAIGVVSAVLMVAAYALGLGGWVKAWAGNNAPALTAEATIVVLGAMAALGGITAFVPKSSTG